MDVLFGLDQMFSELLVEQVYSVDLLHQEHSLQVFLAIFKDECIVCFLVDSGDGCWFGLIVVDGGLILIDGDLIVFDVGLVLVDGEIEVADL